ncbi:hypothetical protein LCGC14_1217520 [marine sediment metagenome]|uniref:Uncharacterized protein n=1 Tax=marine sediment metagenome TaxID=412755 RepID=A0A0F9LG98_9ZZZZ
MKWYEIVDVSELLALFMLGGIAALSAIKGDFGIANTVVGVIGGYMVKSVKGKG